MSPSFRRQVFRPFRKPQITWTRGRYADPGPSNLKHDLPATSRNEQERTRWLAHLLHIHQPRNSRRKMAISDEGEGDTHQGDGLPSCASITPPLSVNRLVVLHARERLLVHPLCWTDRQLALLECRIHRRGEGPRGDGVCERTTETAGPAESAEPVSPKSDRLVRFLARRLKYQLTWSELADTLQKLLRPLGGPMSIEQGYVAIRFAASSPSQVALVLTQRGWVSRPARLYFDRSPRATIEYCRMSVRIPGPASEVITFACIDLDEIMLERRLLFRRENRLGMSDWPGVYRLRSLLKHHTPADPNQDPYLVALLIALAQRERRRAAQQLPLPLPSTFTVGPLHRLLF